MPQTIITGTGCYIPPYVQSNQDFANHVFYSQDQQPLTTEPGEVVNKFKHITGIEERRYTADNFNASDIGTEAAREAIADSGVDIETIDHIIVAHNFGNVLKNTIQTAAVPSLARQAAQNQAASTRYLPSRAALPSPASATNTTPSMPNPALKSQRPQSSSSAGVAWA